MSQPTSIDRSTPLFSQSFEGAQKYQSQPSQHSATTICDQEEVQEKVEEKISLQEPHISLLRLDLYSFIQKFCYYADCAQLASMAGCLSKKMREDFCNSKYGLGKLIRNVDIEADGSLQIEFLNEIDPSLILVSVALRDRSLFKGMITIQGEEPSFFRIEAIQQIE